MAKVCLNNPDHRLRFISIGSGNCDLEVELVEMLLNKDLSNFYLECLDLNEYMLDRGKSLAEAKGVQKFIGFLKADINVWKPEKCYHLVIANQSLHHFLELERIFDTIYHGLENEGYFLADDMIGRNGHMLWPEALEIVKQLWKELPEKYKYNHQHKCLELEFKNWDCSQGGGFEGIRAQDILPLLSERFYFELFLAFGNVINPFIDRSFGHNFKIDSEWDREFIDRVHTLDEEYIEKGIIKPTHMIAAMTKTPPKHTKVYKHLTPEFCIRKSDQST